MIIIGDCIFLVELECLKIKKLRRKKRRIPYWIS